MKLPTWLSKTSLKNAIRRLAFWQRAKKVATAPPASTPKHVLDDVVSYFDGQFLNKWAPPPVLELAWNDVGGKPVAPFHTEMSKFVMSPPPPPRTVHIYDLADETAE